MSSNGTAGSVRTSDNGFTLVVEDRAVQRFDHQIQQVLQVDELDLIVVRTEYFVNRSPIPRNLWAFHRDGRARWRVLDIGFGGEQRYVDVAVWNETRLVAVSQNLGIVVIDVASGGIVAMPGWG